MDRGRNNDRKDNEFFTLDWRGSRPIRFGGRYELTPILEMFNTFNAITFSPDRMAEGLARPVMPLPAPRGQSDTPGASAP